MVKELKPFLNIGPGEFIKEELEARNWRQEDFAYIIGRSPKEVSKLVKNKRITIETAKLLSKAFGQSPQYWINLDTNYRLRLYDESLKEKNTAKKADIYKYLPISKMVKKGWIKSFVSVDELIEEVKNFWNIKKIDFSFLDKEELPNFRKSEAYNQYNKYYALTWFKMAQKCAKKYRVNKYRKNDLINFVNSLYKYTPLHNGIDLFLEELNKMGLKFFVLSHIKKTYIDGASFFDGENPVIVYTQRYDRIDNFWFTIAHELAHILIDLKNPDDYFIDNLDEINMNTEQEANKFASKIIKANEILKYFKSFRNYISESRVINCAKELNISQAIVVGVLQHFDKLPRRHLNKFKIQVSKLIPEKYYIEKHTCLSQVIC